MKIQYDESTPLGSTRITLATAEQGITYETGPPLNQSLRIAWASVKGGGTAVLDLAASRAALPAAAATHMRRREMLVLAYSESGGRLKEVSIPLPVGIPRDAVVAEARSSLGPRWVGESMPFQEVPSRLGTRGARRTVRIWIFIAAALAACFVALIISAWLAALLFNPYMLCLYAFAGGALLFRRGFLEYRNRLAVLGTPTAKANSAAIGLCELLGRARGSHPTPAPITGTESVYWKVEISQWTQSQDGRKGHWNWLLKRESDPLDSLELEDETGRIPVWCRGAELILQKQQWKSQKNREIPAPAQALLASIGKAWPGGSDPNHMHLIETRLQEGGPLYVMGTLAECWRVQAAAAKTAPQQWRAQAQTRSPGSLSAIPGLAWLMLKRWAWKKVHGRPTQPPALDPQCVLVWKGDQGRPFIIADRPERDTLKSLRTRMWAWILAGAGLMAGALYYFLDAVFS